LSWVHHIDEFEDRLSLAGADLPISGERRNSDDIFERSVQTAARKARLTTNPLVIIDDAQIRPKKLVGSHHPMAPDHLTLPLTGESVGNDRRTWAPAAAAPSSVAVADGDQLVSLTDLAARGMTLEWFEAVAIVQGLCQAIVESGDNSGPAQPDLNDVYIDSAGGVAATSGGPQPALATVRCVGEVLSQILPLNDFMSPRSRIVPKATAAAPFFANVKELSDALAYYERPNRPQIIQAVFERWQSLPPPAVAAPPRANAVAVPKPKPRRPRGERSSKWLQLTGVVLLFVAAAGALIMWALKTRPWSAGSYTVTYSNEARTISIY
jgi:hypothetical protein